MKATFRLPDPLMHELRERSKQEGRSLNTIAIDALWRGLGRGFVDDDLSRVLGSFVAERASATYQPEKVEGEVAQLSENARDLSEALDWTRGDH